MKNLMLLGLMVMLGTFSRETEAGVCVGKFANPITDICWDCMFPMTVSGVPITVGEHEDIPNPDAPLCTCADPPKVGIPIGFWEPVRRVDVTRTPYCFVALGGVQMAAGVPAPEGENRLQEDNTKQSNYQVHWYADPVLYWLEVLLDYGCMTKGSFDVAYITEVDPTWNDDELTILLNPETILFGNPIAQAACAGDCVLATASFGSNALFWCAGCQGSIYPLNGHVQAHVSPVQASSLVVQRMTAKLHREGLMMGTYGTQALCNSYPMPVMDKTQYKYSMLYPIPQTGLGGTGGSGSGSGSGASSGGSTGGTNSGAGTSTGTGSSGGTSGGGSDASGGASSGSNRCCQPFGRTTVLWGAGRSFPFKGEDFVYEIFRKRNCCLGVPLP